MIQQCTACVLLTDVGYLLAAQKATNHIAGEKRSYEDHIGSGVSANAAATFTYLLPLGLCSNGMRSTLRTKHEPR